MWFLGMDVGTGGTRAVMVDGDGKADRAARRASMRPSRRRIPAGRSRIPKIGGGRRRRRFAERIAAAPEPQQPIAAIGLTGQMHGAVMLDENGAVLRPALIWCDTRTQPECDWLHREDRLRTADRAHLQPGAAQLHADQAAVGQGARAGDLREDPPHPVPQGLCALPADRRVCHRRAGGLGNAAAGRDASPLVEGSGRGGGDSRELAAQGLRVAGSLRAHQRDGRRADRLAAGTPVVAGAGDQGAGAVGMGILQPGSVSATIGTSGVVFAATAAPTKDPKGRLHTFCHAVPGLWHVMGVTQSAGLSLRWLKETFFAGQDYDELTAAAGQDSRGQRGSGVGAVSAGRAHAASRPRGPRGVCGHLRPTTRRRILCARCWRAWPTRSKTLSRSSPSWAFRSARFAWAAAARAARCGARFRPAFTARLSRCSPPKKAARLAAR